MRTLKGEMLRIQFTVRTNAPVKSRKEAGRYFLSVTSNGILRDVLYCYLVGREVFVTVADPTFGTLKAIKPLQFTGTVMVLPPKVVLELQLKDGKITAVFSCPPVN